MKKRNYTLNFAVAAFVLSTATISWRIYDDLKDWITPPATLTAQRLAQTIADEASATPSEKIVAFYKENLHANHSYCEYLTESAFESHVKEFNPAKTAYEMKLPVLEILRYQGFYVRQADQRDILRLRSIGVIPPDDLMLIICVDKKYDSAEWQYHE
jgi:hypothetical protein